MSTARLQVPTVAAEVVEGVVTPLDVVHVCDRLRETCRHGGARVRRARARLFGPSENGSAVAEATVVLTDGSTVTESGGAATIRRAVDLLTSRLTSRLASHLIGEL